MRLTTLCLAAILFLFPAAFSIAQTGPAAPPAATEIPEKELDKPLFNVPTRLGLLGQLSLSLDDVLRLVLANNNDLANSQLDVLISRFNFISAKSVYDPFIGARTQWQQSTTPISSIIGGGANGKLTTKEIFATPELRGNIPYTGGSYRVSFNSQRTTTNNTFVTLNPQYPSNVTVSLNQPLWRNLRYDQNRQRIEVARNNRNLTAAQLRQSVMDIVTQAEKAYWDVVFAKRNLEVQIEAARSANRQVGSNERMAKEGVLASIEVAEAQVQLANFEQNIYSAQASLTQAENALKLLMLPDRSSAFWSSAIVPTTPPNLDPGHEGLPAAVTAALSNRPEVTQIESSQQIDRANLRYDREQVKPQIDVVASFTTAGLAGRVIPPAPNPITGDTNALVDRINLLSQPLGLPPLSPISFGTGGTLTPILIGGYQQSLSNLTSFNYPTIQAGLEISLPLRNRAAKAAVSASIAELRRDRNQRTKLELQIEADVRTSLQSLESARDRLLAASAARKFASAQYASEQRKFQAGTSTVFLVLQRQTTLITAQNAEIRAQSDLGKAKADVARATGETLTNRHIDIATALPATRNP